MHHAANTIVVIIAMVVGGERSVPSVCRIAMVVGGERSVPSVCRIAMVVGGERSVPSVCRIKYWYLDPCLDSLRVCVSVVP